MRPYFMKKKEKNKDLVKVGKFENLIR